MELRYMYQGGQDFVITVHNEYFKSMHLLPTGTEVKVDEVIATSKGFKVLTNVFATPENSHILSFEKVEKGYKIKGSMAMFGDIEGLAGLYTEALPSEKYEEEIKELSNRQVVKRSEEEIELSVAALIKQMTLDEKIGQMVQSTGMNTALIGADGKTEISEDTAIEKGLVGSVISMLGPVDAYRQQKISVEKSRLGIPLLICQDVIHGYETIFPIPLGGSCSFDTELVEKAMRIAAKEASGEGINLGFSPMLDIARDPRWGRVAESNGEDPYLCSRLCEGHVKGFQGNLEANDSLVACLKHYVGYSAAEGGRDYNSVEISETTLQNIYLPPFKAGIEIGVGSIMSSFNVLDGVPLVINHHACNEILRHQLDFEGILISDFAALDEAIVHGVPADGYEAGQMGVEASLDIEMGMSNYFKYLKSLVENSVIPMSLIDQAVKRILKIKYKCGIMDNPYKAFRPSEKDKIYCEEHLEIAYQLALESCVLLKNKEVLPIDSDKKIALIGPKGDSKDMLGTWQFSHREKDTVTIREAFDDYDINYTYEKACNIETEIVGGFEKATAIAKEADIVILALGEAKCMSGEAASKQDIHLPQVQMNLAKTIVSLGKPTVLVLTNGRPLILDGLEEKVDAILETWFLGSMAGKAIADLVLGYKNPSGKLSMSFPTSTGQIPVYYNQLRTGRPFNPKSPSKFVSRYLDGPNEPLYSFGYGLTYTSFKFDQLKLSDAELSIGASIEVAVQVANTGDKDGVEVIQLYIHDLAAKIARPVKELRGFQRVYLKAGEKKDINFKLSTDDLSYFDRMGKKCLEPGVIKIFVGNSSRDSDLLETKVTIQ